MASAYPVAVIIVAAVIGLVILPLAWSLLSLWQRGGGQIRMSRLSLVCATTPLLAAAFWYAPDTFTPRFAIMAFAVTAVLNIFALMVLLAITFRAQHATTAPRKEIYLVGRPSRNRRLPQRRATAKLASTTRQTVLHGANTHWQPREECHLMSPGIKKL